MSVHWMYITMLLLGTSDISLDAEHDEITMTVRVEIGEDVVQRLLGLGWRRAEEDDNRLWHHFT